MAGVSAIFFALLFAYVLQPAVGALLKLRIPAPLAILFLYCGLFLLLYLLLFCCLPLLWRQLELLLQYLPALFARLAAWWLDLQVSMQRLALPVQMVQAVSNILDQAAAAAGSLAESAAKSLLAFSRWLL